MCCRSSRSWLRRWYYSCVTSPKERAPVAIKLAALLVCALPIAGCTVGPNFKSPVPAVPASWLSGHPSPTPAEHSVAVAAPIDPSWWSLLNDPELNKLVNRVATNNLDVRIATIQLAESRAQRAST